MKKSLLCIIVALCLASAASCENSTQQQQDAFDKKKYPFRIIEALPNPEGVDIGKEYVLIRNVSGDSAALINWYYTGRLLLRSTFGVAGKVPADWEAKVGTGRTNEFLHNTADTLRFYAPDNTLIQTIIWANAGDGQIVKAP